MRWLGHAAAVTTVAVLALANMRGWLVLDLVPPPSSGFPGYMAVAEDVQRALFTNGRVPRWSPEWFAGRSELLSSFKEILTLPLVPLVGTARSIQLVIIGAKIAAAVATYALFVRLLGAPFAGLLAGYAYAFGENGNRLAWRLDGAISYALFAGALLAAAELLRRPGPRPAVALATVVAAQFLTNYLHVLLLALLVSLLGVLRPWPVVPSSRPRPLEVFRWQGAWRSACALHSWRGWHSTSTIMPSFRKARRCGRSVT